MRFVVDHAHRLLELIQVEQAEPNAAYAAAAPAI